MGQAERERHALKDLLVDISGRKSGSTISRELGTGVA